MKDQGLIILKPSVKIYINLMFVLFLILLFLIHLSTCIIILHGCYLKFKFKYTFGFLLHVEWAYGSDSTMHIKYLDIHYFVYENIYEE